MLPVRIPVTKFGQKTENTIVFTDQQRHANVMVVAEGRGHVYCKQRCPELPRGLPAGDPEEAEDAGSRCESAVASNRPQGVGSQKRRIETAGLQNIASEPRGG